MTNQPWWNMMSDIQRYGHLYTTSIDCVHLKQIILIHESISYKNLLHHPFSIFLLWLEMNVLTIFLMDKWSWRQRSSLMAVLSQNLTSFLKHFLHSSYHGKLFFQWVMIFYHHCHCHPHLQIHLLQVLLV